MRVLIQRVSEANVKINQVEYSRISKGMLVLVGIENDDTEEDIDYLCKKILNLRIFDDEEGVMNESVLQKENEIMVISQFTLHANTRKGNRPSFRSSPLRSHPVHKGCHPDGSHTASFHSHPCRTRR